jgi:hypothetical protein
MSNELMMDVIDYSHTNMESSSSTTTQNNNTIANTLMMESAISGEGWDDEALAASLMKHVHHPRAASSSSTFHSTTTELLDMNSLSIKRREEDDIAERMRVEDTKAQLAAAKAGMEREAARLAAEAAAAAAASETKSTGSSSSSMNKSWIAPHLRGGAMGMTTSTRTGFGTKLDTQSEELFPDLHMADAILEKQQQQLIKAVAANSKVTVGSSSSSSSTMGVGAGATWGGAMTTSATRPTLQLKKVPKKPPMEPRPKEDDASSSAIKENKW